MINSKLELQFYICADSMMNRGYFEKIAVNEGRFSYSSGLDYGILDGIT